MPPSFRRSLPIAGVAVIVCAALSLAQAPVSAAPHVRPESTDLRELLDELTDRSATARGLVRALDDSDVLVYVRHRLFTESLLDGRTGLLRCDRPSRYVIIELAPARQHLDTLVTLGHELQHAVEIAGAPHIVDAPSLAAHYARIGIRMTGAPAQSFETDAARHISARIRRELLATTVRTTHDRH